MKIHNLLFSKKTAITLMSIGLALFVTSIYLEPSNKLQDNNQFITSLLLALVGVPSFFGGWAVWILVRHYGDQKESK